MGNTMIEEVTALLVGIVTRRALVIDFRGGGVFGFQRPAQCFQRPLALDLESLLPLFQDSKEGEGRDATEAVPGQGLPSRVQAAPEDSSAAYARYAELLACADWRDALGDAQGVAAENFFGFPFAYLNPHLGHLLSPTGVFGDHLFQSLHAHLHRPVFGMMIHAPPPYAAAPDIQDPCSVYVTFGSFVALLQ